MNTETQIKITSKQLEAMRRKYYKSFEDENFIPIESFTREANDGNYAIIEGKRVSMVTYGEKIMEATQ